MAFPVAPTALICGLFLYLPRLYAHKNEQPFVGLVWARTLSPHITIHIMIQALAQPLAYGLLYAFFCTLAADHLR